MIWGSLAMKKWPGQGRQGRGAADDHPRHADRETAPRGKTGRRQGAGLGRTYGREGGFGPGRDAWPARWRLRCTDATRRRGAGKVFLTGMEKKPEVSEKRVYRISRKIIGFSILISDEI